MSAKATSGAKRKAGPREGTGRRSGDRPGEGPGERRVREIAVAYDDRGRHLLFDTNVLVAGLVEQHQHHERASLWIKRAVIGEVAMHLAQHALAECFSMLTVLHIRPAITPDQALRLLRESLLGACRAKVISLTADEYLDALGRCTLRGLRGGVVHDAVIARCAEKAGARILTFNQRDFARLCRNADDDVVAP